MVKNMVREKGLSDGSEYIREWAEDKFNGHGRKIDANGHYHIGSWKNDMHDGYGEEHWLNG